MIKCEAKEIHTIYVPWRADVWRAIKRMTKKLKMPLGKLVAGLVADNPQVQDELKK